MLSGYALAVVAGFLTTRPEPATPWILLTTWVAARLASALGHGPLALAAGLSFPIALLAVAVPPLLQGAKRWENRIVPAALGALLAADAAWWTGTLWRDASLQHHALLAAVDLFALLLLIVGGRALPAAMGGYLERQGIPRHDRIRRGYELPLAALAGGACLLDATGLGAGAGTLSVAAALVTLVRVARWQLHRSFARPELWALALGYLWLVPGLLVKAVAQLTNKLPVTDALHGVTVGALGTLTLVMMARTATLRARRPLEGFGDVGAAALLISVAALCRLLSPLAPSVRDTLLWVAAAGWSLAFLLVLPRLVRTAR